MSKFDPEIIREWNKKFLFGLVKIKYTVEDRGPQCEPGAQFKHFLFIDIGKRRYDWTFRTKYLYEKLPSEYRI